MTTYNAVIDIKKLVEGTQNYKKQMFQYASFITPKNTRSNANANYGEILKSRKKILFSPKPTIRYYTLSIYEINEKKRCWRDIKNNRIKLLIK